MPGAGVELSALLKRRKLFIPSSDKTHKYARNAEVRYTTGTRSVHHFYGRSYLVVEVCHETK